MRTNRLAEPAARDGEARMLPAAEESKLSGTVDSIRRIDDDVPSAPTPNDLSDYG
ncbi:hypothetical protein L1A08_21930 [Rubinisphaera sp. ICM_H10]|nr:hypothetical protein [Rubinisphaera margarita]